MMDESYDKSAPPPNYGDGKLKHSKYHVIFAGFTVVLPYQWQSEECH